MNQPATTRRLPPVIPKAVTLAADIEADYPQAAKHLRHLSGHLTVTRKRLRLLRLRRDELVTAVDQLMRHTNTQTIAAVAAALARAKTEH